jgi:hypothetical protein
MSSGGLLLGSQDPLGDRFFFINSKQANALRGFLHKLLQVLGSADGILNTGN